MSMLRQQAPRSPMAQLAVLGFTQDGTEFHRLGLTLAIEGRWGVLTSEDPSPPPDPCRAQMGRPGLWRATADEARPGLMFDIPPLAFLPATSDGPSPLESVLDWALATLESRTPRGWQPPAPEEAGEWIGDGALIARSGALVTPGTLVCEPDRLAVEFPRLAEIPESLPLARRRWLTELLRDAQQRWRLVRLGVGPEGGTIRGEIDLTGVPQPLARSFTRLGAAALRWVVEWLLEPVSVILDPDVESKTLARIPHRGARS